MNIVQTPVAPLSPELITRFRTIVGDKYAVTEPADVAPYVTEERGLFHGHSPLICGPVRPRKSPRSASLPPNKKSRWCRKAAIPV